MLVHIVLEAAAVLLSVGSLVYERDRTSMPLLACATLCLLLAVVL